MPLSAFQDTHRIKLGVRHWRCVRNPTLATLRATRYCCPSFSSSAMTHCVTQGMHSAYRQSIIPCTKSICSRIHTKPSMRSDVNILVHAHLHCACNKARRADIRASYNDSLLLRRLPPEPHLVFDGKVDEVGVHQHLVRRPQLRIVLEEQRCGYLVAAARLLLCVNETWHPCTAVKLGQCTRPMMHRCQSFCNTVMLSRIWWKPLTHDGLRCPWPLLSSWPWHPCGHVTEHHARG